MQYLKSVPDDGQVKSSLTFLLAALQALRLTTPLAESFLVQLDVDLEGGGFEDIRPNIKVSNAILVLSSNP